MEYDGVVDNLAVLIVVRSRKFDAWREELVGDQAR